MTNERMVNVGDAYGRNNLYWIIVFMGWKTSQTNRKEMIMASAIKHCDCKHSFQDQEYGIGKRLHTIAKPKETPVTHRCTVCGKETRAGHIDKEKTTERR